MRRLLHKWLVRLVELTEAKPKTWKLEKGHVIEPAFVSDGVQYYMMKDTFNSYSGRALDALDVYEQWNMRCTREFLKEWIDVFDAILSKPHIKIEDLVKLKIALAERMNYAIPTRELIYKFAAVAFFDENENPYTYDHAYGQAKIERWKKAMDIEAFFLTVPIGTLIPLPDLSAIDLTDYLKVLDMVEGKESQMLSELRYSKAGNPVTS